MSKPKIVKTIDYYGAIDGLNGRQLRKGEKIEILFPDGSVQHTYVSLEEGYGSAQIDMNNHPDTYRTSKAYFYKLINEATVKIYLRDSGLKVRRI